MKSNQSTQFKTKWFTIVELIVVITILAILGTIWFVSYVDYISSSRDSSRLSQIQVISQAIEWNSKWRAPMPDNKVTIYANWVAIWYQWYAWENVLSELWVNEWGKDPKDWVYYTYFVDSKQKNTQLLAFLENEEDTLTFNLVNQAKAVDYTERIAKTFWAKLGVLVEMDTKIPVQELSAVQTSGLDIVTTTTNYTAYITSDKTITWTWKVLQKLQQSIWHKWVWFWAPQSCPEWFIAVPWNPDFNQPGFCVMKYEATYEDAISPTQAVNNSFNYQALKVPVSKPWLYPVWNMTQNEAITACKSIWEWYHLITNNERMTIARNIEQVWGNWSWNSIWNGWIFTWLNYTANTTTSFWCTAINSIWGTWGTVMATSLNYDTDKWGSNKSSDCDSKRQLQLSNWEIIWDFAWNIREHVNWANTLDWTNHATMNWNTCWTTGFTEFNICSFVAPYSYENQWPLTSWLSSTKWIWRIYSVNSTSRVFLRWSSDNTDFWWFWWIYNLYTWRDSLAKATVAGFRCAK